MRSLLSVGIDNYRGALKLEGCCSNAKAFSDVMEKNDDSDKTRNFSAKLVSNVSTIAELKTLIKELFNATDVTTSVFYFSGHGVFTETGGYLVTPDYQKNNEGVSMQEILRIANESKAKDKIIILDCCHSGAFGLVESSGDVSSQLYSGVVILTSSSKDEKSRLINGKGVFTNLLINALEGGAADLNGNITPGGVYAYIDQALGPWDKQRPIFRTNVSRFTVLRKVTPQIHASIIERITTYFKEPDMDFELDPSFESTNNPDEVHLLKQPYTDKNNKAKFDDLQAMRSVGLVVPVVEKHMYWAAMNGSPCRLTALGKHYWRLVDEKKFNHR